MLAGPSGSTTSAYVSDQWRFRVFLDDKAIGEHTFILETTATGAQVLTSSARFAVRILFFDAYTYEHTSRESWKDGCLTQISARTNDNGDAYRVSGTARNNGFEVQAAEDSTLLSNCVMTFAYWQPEFLGQRKLLNAQTGEYVDVIVSEPTTSHVLVRGESVPATRYRLTAEGREIDLWYSADQRWIALESTTDSSKRLRYVIE